MLVLTRRSGESIVIGDDVRIRVLGTSGSRVRIGIEAPREVRIVREKWTPLDAETPNEPGALRPAADASFLGSARCVPIPVRADRHMTLE